MPKHTRFVPDPRGETIDINSRPAAVSLFSRSRVVFWAIAVAWAALIFYFSTAKFAPGFSEWLIAQALTFLHVSFSSRIVQVLDALVRKSAHMIEYGILTLLLYGSFASKDPFRWRPRRALWCVFIAGAYSLTDEFHQRFVPGRHASLMDCGVDAVGAMIAIAIATWVNKGFDRPSSTPRTDEPGGQCADTQKGGGRKPLLSTKV
jgi:VanZ family protein